MRDTSAANLPMDCVKLFKFYFKLDGRWTCDVFESSPDCIATVDYLTEFRSIDRSASIIVFALRSLSHSRDSELGSTRLLLFVIGRERARDARPFVVPATQQSPNDN